MNFLTISRRRFSHSAVTPLKEMLQDIEEKEREKKEEVESDQIKGFCDQIWWYLYKNLVNLQAEAKLKKEREAIEAKLAAKAAEARVSI